MSESTANPEGTDLAVTFLAAFNDIEAHLRSELNAKRSDSFRWMVRLAEKKHLISKEHAEALDDYAELRNAISHGQYNNLRPIADPRPDTVKTIEKIRDFLINPPIALNVLSPQKVKSFHLDDPITRALEIVRTTEISQFPVYQSSNGSSEYVALLTTNTIARWVASDLADNAHLDARSIEEVLNYAESSDLAVFLPRTTTAQAVVDVMSAPELPWSVIITEHGKPHEKPLRVITGRDMRTLLEILKVS